MAHTQLFPVRFDDVDYARVVFFPKLFAYAHRVFEDFFQIELGESYATVLERRKIGFPSVHAEADFIAPLRFGDTCRAVLEVERVSKGSIACRYELLREAPRTLAATIRIVVATIDLDTFAPIAVPDDLRALFLRHIRADGE